MGFLDFLAELLFRLLLASKEPDEIRNLSDSPGQRLQMAAT